MNNKQRKQQMFKISIKNILLKVLVVVVFSGPAYAGETIRNGYRYIRESSSNVLTCVEGKKYISSKYLYGDVSESNLSVTTGTTLGEIKICILTYNGNEYIDTEPQEYLDTESLQYGRRVWFINDGEFVVMLDVYKSRNPEHLLMNTEMAIQNIKKIKNNE